MPERQPEARGQEAKAARCPKARPPGLGGHQSMKCNNGFVGLEDEWWFGSIAWFKREEAAAKEV